MRTRRGGRAVLALAVALAVDGWLLLTAVHDATRWFGLAMLVTAVPVAGLGERSRGRTAPSAGTRAPAARDVAPTLAAPRRRRGRPGRIGAAPTAVVGLMLLGAVLAAAGRSLGGADGRWRDQPYLVDTLAGLTVAVVGAALVVLVMSLTSGRHGSRRSLAEARLAAGATVATMMASACDLLAAAPTGGDWRVRGRDVVADLRSLVAAVDEAERALGRGDAGEHLVVLRERWSAVVAEPRGPAWRDLAHGWSLMEGDIRTRLVAAGDWLPPATAARVRHLVADPGAGRNTPAGALACGLGPRTPPGTALVVLAESRRYAERLLLLVVQLLDLGELYEPPADDVATGRTAPSTALGRLSAIAVEPVTA